MSKRCTKCKEVKFEDDFAKDKKGKDGLQYWCRACQSKSRKAKRIREGLNVRILTKLCTRCIETKPRGDFARCRSSKDRLQYWCKDCHAEVWQEKIAQRSGCWITNKTCAKCHTFKPLLEFGVDNRNKDKKSIYCKKCNQRKSLAYLTKLRTVGNIRSKKSWLRRLLNY